jgi:Tfp pilus assembly protein PilX
VRPLETIAIDLGETMQMRILTALSNKNSEAGFALIAAIMACLILLALGMLVISLSSQDIRVSMKIVGEKRALAAAETGIGSLAQTFNPQSPITVPTTVARADGVSNYTVNYPATRPALGPIMIPLTGYSIGGGQMWGQSRYNIDVTGNNTEYGTRVTIGVGVGYGPVEMSTMSR